MDNDMRNSTQEAAARRLEMTDPDNRSLWALWLVLTRLFDGVERGEVLPPLDTEFPDTAPMSRPLEGDEG